MYTSDDNVSVRVKVVPRGSIEPHHIGTVLEGMGFKRATVDSVTLWDQTMRHERTSTSFLRRISYSGNGHYTAFILIEGSTPTTVGATAELGDNPEERLKKYLQHRLEGFVLDVLAHYFEIEETHQ